VPQSANFYKSAQPEREPSVYYTHDNGGRPFKVDVAGDIRVFLETGFDEKTQKTTYATEPAHTFAAERVFVGQSGFNDMTAFSGGHGPDFDGNSLLLKISEGEYVWIGSTIFAFHTEHEIVRYESPVGNNDVPYPYAVDSHGRYYLLIENVILSAVPESCCEPYTYYYDHHYVVYPAGHVNMSGEACTFDGITSVYSSETGPDLMYLWYQPGSDDMGYEWTCQDHGIWAQEEVGGPRHQLDKARYLDLMQKFGDEKGYTPLKTTCIEKRQW